jgi:DNA-binding winged helix-turn-helix (wHTH) protein
VIEIDEQRHIVTMAKGKAILTPKEYGLLHTLTRGNGRVFTREELLKTVWGEFETDTRTVDQHIARLRGKLGADSVAVITVTNYGYRIEGVTIKNDEVPTGVVQTIERKFGKKPHSYVLLKVDNVLEKMKKGDKVPLNA